MLEILTSAALSPLQHGFFTRKGGASSGIFQGLNCGPGSSDLSEVVAINRARVAAAMQVAPDHLITLNQTHSADVLTLTAPPEREAKKWEPVFRNNPATNENLPQSDRQSDRLRADAMVTATPGLGLGVLTADCQPVLFADARAGVIGAAHAGWRGTRDGVLEATLEAMETLGARRATITAVIGPTISQAAYEVGPEFVESFLDDDPESARFFINGKGNRALFDLPAYGLARLRAAGIGHAEWTRHCTYSDPERFYSFRRTTHAGEADYGRLISVIRL